MDANKALELATIAFPNDTEMRSVYMLGLDKGYELCKEQMMKDYISKETAKKIARGSLGVQDFIRKIDRHTEDKQ